MPITDPPERSCAIKGSVNLFTSPAYINITAALLKAQKAMRAVDANAVNPDYDHKYSDLGAVLDAVKPLLNDQDILVLQPPGAELHEGGIIGVLVETILIHESGEYIGCGLRLYSNRCDAHGFGSLETYARRYALASLLAMKTNQDNDGNGAAGNFTAPASITQPPHAAGHSAPAAANANETLEHVLVQIRQIPQECQDKMWATFSERTGRTEVNVQPTDLPLLQLLLTRGTQRAS